MGVNNEFRPKVSVLIAAYNVENTIVRCIESVIRQTMTDIEVIIVDDCSTDRTVSLVQTFIELDPRIKLVQHHFNLGLGETRNSGIKCATAPYIVFLDADDTVEPVFCERLVKLAEISNADLVVSAYKVKVVGTHPSEHVVSQEDFTDIDISKYLEAVLASDTTAFTWNKLYIRSIIESNALRFEPRDVLENVEDRLFTILYLFVAKTVVFNQEPLYNYYVHANSIVGKYQDGLFSDILVLDNKLRILFSDDVRFWRAIDRGLQWNVFSILFNETKEKPADSPSTLSVLRILSKSTRFREVFLIDLGRFSIGKILVLLLLYFRGVYLLIFLMKLQKYRRN